MPKLILIKHSAPQVVPAAPAETWHLSDVGIQRCKPLADYLSAYAPLAIVSSEEVKASETAAEVARHLGTTFETRPDLGEHDRGNVPHLPASQFISMMELFFRRPRELVLGRETAEGALNRFRSAVDEAITEKSGQDVAIVSHGTVLALFLAHYTRQPGFGFWRKMGLPSVAVLSLPDFNLIELVDRI